MNHSPYQHQDPRQISLQRQLQQARDQNDQRRRALLELQWVHRFGVQTLPQASSDDAIVQQPLSAELGEQPEHVAAVVTAKSPSSAAVASKPVCELALAQQPEPEPEQEPEPVSAKPPSTGLNRFTSLLKDCLDDVGRTVDSDGSRAPATPTTPPVPAAGPQRLRRWLTPVGHDDLPKAS